MASNFDYEAYFAKSRHTAIEKARFELAKAEDMKEAIDNYITRIIDAVVLVEADKKYEKECDKIRSAVTKAAKKEWAKYEV